MRHRLVCFALALVCAFPAAAAGPAEYDAASGFFPDQGCPPWQLIDTADESPVLVFPGGPLVLNTSTNVENIAYVQSEPLVDFSSTVVIEARVRFVSGTSSSTNRSAAVILFTSAPNFGNALFIDRDRVFLLAAGDVVGPSATVDTDGAFHTYKLEVEPGGIIRVFYDGVLQFTGASFISASNNGPTKRIAFGEFSLLATGRSEWQFIRHNASVLSGNDCLVSWWRAEGNADDSADANHGTLEGGTTFESGLCDGSAFSFDGLDDRVRIADAVNLDGMAEFSFTGWVRFRTVTLGTWQWIISKGSAVGFGSNSYSIWLDDSARIAAAVESSTVLNTAGAPDIIVAGRRYHVAATYDGALIRLYLDGVLRGTAPLTGAVRNTTFPVFLGRRSGTGVDGNGDSIDGTIDEARVWSRALTAEEVLAAVTGGCDNTPPDADAGDDQTVECTGSSTSVTLDGSGSSDPDVETLTYQWFKGTNPLASGVTAEVMLTTGAHEIRLKVTDPAGASSEDVVIVNVVDTTAPSFTPVEDLHASTGFDATTCSVHIPDSSLLVPVASDLCSGVTVTRSGIPAGNEFPVGATTVTYTLRDAAGNTATDTQLVTVVDDTPPVVTPPANVDVTGTCDGATVDPGTATATDNCTVAMVAGVRSDGKALADPYPVGTTTIVWTATDASTNTASANQSVAVRAGGAPVISGAGATPSRLWPANHKMVNVVVEYEVSGACSDVETTLSVSSSDPTDAKGDNTSPDWVIVDVHNVMLRAERSPGSAERLYTITIQATDADGHTARSDVLVRVAPR